MDNSHTQTTFGTIHRAKTNKNTTPGTIKGEQTQMLAKCKQFLLRIRQPLNEIIWVF